MLAAHMCQSMNQTLMEIENQAPEFYDHLKDNSLNPIVIYGK
jgi:hypothetical protein